MSPLRKRAIRNAYYEGVIDGIGNPAPDPGGTGSARDPEQRVRRQGWFDTRSKRVLRGYQFSVEEVLRRVEVREASGVTAGQVNAGHMVRY